MQGWFLLILIFPVVIGESPSITPTKGRPWPLPQHETPGKGRMTIDANDFVFVATGYNCPILENAFKRYEKIMFSEVQSRFGNDKRMSNKIDPSESLQKLYINIQSPCEIQPYLKMDEKYELKICSPTNHNKATLVTNSIWGALRGLETFSQIVTYDGISTTFTVRCTKIMDFPRFPHRGILLDTSRHYLPLNILIDNLDLMAMNKFNVFHWHMVDDQSFPYQSELYPNLSANGSWSTTQTYSADDITFVVSYAANLGIRVIPEFDTPGHVRSWGKGQPGLLTPCYRNGVPDGTFGPIDPTQEKTFIFLKNLFTEIMNLFPDRYVHLGGDEVSFDCWKSNPYINKFMTSMKMEGDYKKLEGYYIERLTDIISKLPSHNSYIVWQEVFDNMVELTSDAIVHVWKYDGNSYLYHRALARTTAAGHQALLSACWYLDHLTHYTEWERYYNCEPHGFSGTEEQKKLVLGGEACMWGELVDETNVISRTWPRSALVAERLWSSKAISNMHKSLPRFSEQRCRLFRRGYDVAPIGPFYCPEII